MRAIQVTEPLCEHGEGAVWWARTSRFRWVDMNRGVILERGEDGVARQRTTGLPSVAFLRPLSTGGFVAGSVGDLWAFDDDPPWSQPRGHLISSRRIGTAPIASDERFNEGCADPQGRVLAGSTTVPRRPTAAALYRFDLNGTAETLIQGITLGNGVSFTSDPNEFLLVDTPTRTIRRYVVRDDGSLSSAVFVNLNGVNGWPDGLCVDAEDGVWIAMFGGSEVRRYDRDGALTDTIDLPTPSVTSCALGGSDGRTLFVTTSRQATTDDPIAGAAFEATVRVPGVPVLGAHQRST